MKNVIDSKMYLKNDTAVAVVYKIGNEKAKFAFLANSHLAESEDLIAIGELCKELDAPASPVTTMLSGFSSK